MHPVDWLEDLYKFDAKGKLRFWRCGSKDDTYLTEFGDVWNNSGKRGKIRQTEPKLIKANARQPDATIQAQIYAKQCWDEKIRKDSYYPSATIPTCNAEEWLEMHNDYRKWPALCLSWKDMREADKDCSPELIWITQYKVDGNRVTAWYTDDTLKLYSRTCQELQFKDHIRTQLEALFQIINYVMSGETDQNHYNLYKFGIDGEIWNPKDTFHQRSHAIASRTVNKSKDDEQLCFAWFDIIDYDKSFGERAEIMRKVRDFLLEFGTDMNQIGDGKESPKGSAKRGGMSQSKLCLGGDYANIFVVPTFVAVDPSHCYEQYARSLGQGFEGLVLRRPTHMYPKNKNTRHVDMVKMKPVEDGEFEVIGFEEATGDRAGCVVWLLRNDKTDATFGCAQMGTLEYQRELYQNGDKYIGKKLTVLYTERSEDDIPKQPRAKTFRPDEDLDIE
uniref:ATP-dependent DNA ligase family profile domain-containing protein n=1 Tax=viral metagenome TaxID=1070528 RepID=A0A6C0CGQ0_9ZZZZ